MASEFNDDSELVNVHVVVGLFLLFVLRHCGVVQVLVQTSGVGIHVKVSHGPKTVALVCMGVLFGPPNPPPFTAVI